MTIKCPGCGRVSDYAQYPPKTSFAGAGPIPKMTKTIRQSERDTQMALAISNANPHLDQGKSP